MSKLYKAIKMIIVILLSVFILLLSTHVTHWIACHFIDVSEGYMTKGEKMNTLNLENIRILVVGDIMLDKYTVGTVDRISPEAPVPVVNVVDEYYTLGGCGNVVRNIRELGVEVDCLASIGNDFEGKTVWNSLEEIGAANLVFFGSERTTTKERIIANFRSVQMLRIDREINEFVPSEMAIQKIKKTKNEYDMIIISDYAKGMISKELIQYLKSNYKTRIIVDPKPINAWMYNDVFMLTPNEKEWKEMQLSSSNRFDKVRYILQTLGRNGMKLIEGYKEWFIEAKPVEIYNVSGAGDTVVAIMAVCLSMGLEAPESAKIANQCAAYVVTQSGTAVVPKNIFLKSVNEFF
jgi:D-glycero-beta-D-manno-heptose-7-phosphate kinase